ncbi:MAG: hypothetical protein K6G22_00305 [Lachnospiraceae bacterium]|nr:hypothetical protein [Lachnospiraceae bacterium]
MKKKHLFAGICLAASVAMCISSPVPVGAAVASDTVYEPDVLCRLARDNYIDVMMEHYCLNLVDDGEYYMYEGDIGNVIPEYKNVDLDGDGEYDVIKRKGTKYTIKFSDGGTLRTDEFTRNPNEGEVIEFADMNEDNVDEILIAHYTDGTAGPTVWDTYIYSRIDGRWTAFPIVGKDSSINSEELIEHIEDVTGEDYEPGCVRVAGIQLGESAIELLLDYGDKTGPEQIVDYEAVTLFKAFDPKYLKNYDDFRMLDSGVADFVRNWPIEFTGKGIKLTSDLQYKANIFLSNFSEQRYRGNSDYNPAEYAHFAMEWLRINKAKEIINFDNYSWINQAQINTILERYFGANLCESDFYAADKDNVYGGIIRKGADGKDFYCEPLAGGEMYKNNAFSVVFQMEDLGSDNKDKTKDRYLRMYFTVYSLDTDEYDKTGIGKKHYSMSDDEAVMLVQKNKLYEEESGFAIVNEVKPGEYKLMYYYIYDSTEG